MPRPENQRGQTADDQIFRNYLEKPAGLVWPEAKPVRLWPGRRMPPSGLENPAEKPGVRAG